MSYLASALFFYLWISAFSAFSAQSLPPLSSEVAKLEQGFVLENKEWGSWEDLFFLEDQELFILRQGVELFLLSATKNPSLQKVLSLERLDKTQILRATLQNGKFWLFLYSTGKIPFALEIFSGQIVEFPIEGLRLPGKQTPTIQSALILSATECALLMIAGGDSETWPREGNRPLYFWMSLREGKRVSFPLGWDLEYFSDSQDIAVFEKPQEQPFQRRPLQAVDLHTGEFLKTIPSRHEKAYIPFDWSETQSLQPLYRRYLESGDTDYFSGFSVDGIALLRDLQLRKTGVFYLATAKAHDGFIGFRLRKEGAGSLEPSTLWVTEMKPEGTPFALAPDIVDFALLDQGKMIFVHARSELNPDRKQSYEAFFWNPESKVAWNLLEGVERLPPLAPEFQKFSYIEDKIKITLIESSQKHPKWGRFVLAIFRHFRGDLRSFVWNSQEKAIKRTFWQRAILLTSKGQRYLLDLFAEENLPDQLWLHSSGKIFSVNFVWNTEGSDSQRSFQLSEKTFSCP